MIYIHTQARTHTHTHTNMQNNICVVCWGARLATGSKTEAVVIPGGTQGAAENSSQAAARLF